MLGSEGMDCSRDSHAGGGAERHSTVGTTLYQDGRRDFEKGLPSGLITVGEDDGPTTGQRRTAIVVEE